LYTEPFIINNEGRNILYVYAVDQAGNRETSLSYTNTISETAPTSHYALLCNELTIYGNVKGNSLYCNGTISIYGNGHWDALGTSENSFMITGQQQISNIVTSGAKQSLPQPNWQAINQVTTERNDTQINVNSVLTDLRFEAGLMVSGTTKIKNILVVKGDLTFNGNVEMDDACIICTGKVTTSGSISGTGLIYAGNGLTVWGNCNISGEVMINGPVTMAGTETFLSGDVRKYLSFLQ
jgi:cytoskeletal protein CcmA (bactofilin family)